MKGTEQHHGNKLEDTSFDEPSIPSSPAPSYVELPSTSVDAYSQPIGNDAKIRGMLHHQEEKAQLDRAVSQESPAISVTDVQIKCLRPK